MVQPILFGSVIDNYMSAILLTIVIMPHFGLIDDSLQKAEASLLRARLHVRGGKIRLSQGRTEDGVAALYDAMVHAMFRFFDSSESRRSLQISLDDDLNDDRVLFLILQKSGIIGKSIDIADFDYICQKMDESIEGKLIDFDEGLFMSRFNRIMTDLQAIPFDESELPEGPAITL